jgi:membrane-bound metal-dependent hydrolase YbcI (DUF457 family)
MDTLAHYVLAFVGGYVLVKGLKLSTGTVPLIALPFLSVLIDADHFFFRRFDQHNVFVVGALACLALLFCFLKKARLRNYALLLAVMVFGHIIIDMGDGQGVHLFYPLTRELFALPQTGLGVTSDLEVIIGPYKKLSEPVTSPMGVAFAIYYGTVFILIAASKLFEKKRITNRI